MKPDTKKGRVTIPTETGFLEDTLRIMERWSADAVRDCDGTTMPPEIVKYAQKVYSTYFVTRGDNKFALANLDERQHFFLLSKFVTATAKTITISLLDGYLAEQVAPDYNADPHRYWEVIDRTTGALVSSWSADKKTDSVTVEGCTPFHEYTVSFLAVVNWDSTQMYNYITNNWTREKEIPYDPRYPKTAQYILDHMQEWLDAHKDTSVVRFTTFLYHFSLLFNDQRKEKFVDWFGYGGSVSPQAIDDFEKEYGYRLRAEDFVDAGSYNSTFRVPTKAYRDYMDFVQKFVSRTAKKLVDIVHKNGREAMMFLGDTWIGTEPYGKYFKDIGLDAVVGSVGGGVTIRMLSDIEDVKYTEGRFLPYFFPDTFKAGGEPTKELNKNWLTARRAMLRKPVDRIGYGGYLSLAAKFPDFIERVGEICEEFRKFYDVVKGAKPYCAVKVAVLNSWGKLRSWQSHMVAHELKYKQIYSYQGILESLSGMSADVSFISFDDIRQGGVPQGIDVIINAGDAYTAFSGDTEWLDADVVSIIREWVHRGGGFVGVGEPSAILKNGKYFQLSSLLGVERELGLTLSTDKYNNTPVASHFVTEDLAETFDSGEVVNNIYALDGADVLTVKDGNVTAAANTYGLGRGVYLAGLPYSVQNARLLLRALVYAAKKEKIFGVWYSDNPFTECNYYPEKKLACIVNNSAALQDTVFFDGSGVKTPLALAPMEIRWISTDQT